MFVCVCVCGRACVHACGRAGVFVCPVLPCCFLPFSAPPVASHPALAAASPLLVVLVVSVSVLLFSPFGRAPSFVAPPPLFLSPSPSRQRQASPVVQQHAGSWELPIALSCLKCWTRCYSQVTCSGVITFASDAELSCLGVSGFAVFWTRYSSCRSVDQQSGKRTCSCWTRSCNMRVCLKPMTAYRPAPARKHSAKVVGRTELLVVCPV